ncbi:MAG: tRNA (guanosine(37)-N1)-methyltransferase TrmD [Jatrophihabitans sp.]
MRLDVVTIFPDYLDPLRQSLLGRAIARGQVQLGVHNLRQWTDDVHRTVDDTPYGGGPGMVMLPEPWARALDDIVPVNASPDAPVPRLIIPTPAGTPFTQSAAARLAQEPWLVFACGRYEGIDARFAEYAAARMPVEEISLGDYVLAGGEVAVLVIAEAVSRLLAGVLGNAHSAVDDSFSAGPAGLLEAPAYTKPASWRGMDVPEVLLSGHRAAITAWREECSRARTAERRPDLLGRDCTD